MATEGIFPPRIIDTPTSVGGNDIHVGLTAKRSAWDSSGWLGLVATENGFKCRWSGSQSGLQIMCRMTFRFMSSFVHKHEQWAAVNLEIFAV